MGDSFNDILRSKKSQDSLRKVLKKGFWKLPKDIKPAIFFNNRTIEEALSPLGYSVCDDNTIYDLHTGCHLIDKKGIFIKANQIVAIHRNGGFIMEDDVLFISKNGSQTMVEIKPKKVKKI